MKLASIRMLVLFSAVLGTVVLPSPADAALSLGRGTEGLLGGDLSDPDDTVVPTDKNMASAEPEDVLRPPNATWLTMKCAPANGPGMTPHQIHPYQSWQNSPACAIFLNRPETMKWYVGFKDGGYGGPTIDEPYYAAIELKDPYFLTHFTITPSPEMPGRDPKSWAIQGSNTGKDGDWADIYVCDVDDRNGTPIKEPSRCETFLFTSFTSDDMAEAIRPEDAKKLEAKLAGETIYSADFTRPPKTYSWFRIVVYSCFNPNSTYVEDFNFPPGFALSQLELFGVPGPREPEIPWEIRSVEIAKAKAEAQAARAARLAEEEKRANASANSHRAFAEKIEREAAAAQAAILAAEKQKAREEEMAKKAAEAQAAFDVLMPPVFDAPFMITYWGGPSKADTTLERYQEIADCGFNVAFPAFDNLWQPADEAQEQHNKTYLDLCQQVGLRALVWDGNMAQPEGWKPPTAEEIPAIEKAMDDLVARYASHPALLGYVVRDEPGREAFSRIGVINKYLLEKDPDHLPFINLMPNYAGTEISEWRGRAYERSVSSYLEEVRPALLSWSHFRQMLESGDERYYWENLEIMRRNGLARKTPYFQIIVTLKHMGYRECSETDLRWQVWTSLAYGTRGIAYFTYSPGTEDAPALLTRDGRRDAKWDYVKKINQRIAQLGPTLVTLKSTGVYCTNPRPIGTKRLDADAPVKKATGGSLAIGFFEDAQGAVYILPVNRSFRSRITATLTLADTYASAAEISQETGDALADVDVSAQAFEVSLEAGEGKLFHLK